MSSAFPRSMTRVRHWWRLFLRVLAGTLFGVYIGWQAFWLAQAKIPPALFLRITGLPAPTTGGTRSMIQLWQGNWRESLRCNPMAIPISSLFLLSLGWVGWELVRSRRARLPDWFLGAWLVVLGVAWIFKLCGDPTYW